ncbi:MAG: ABC transporter permease [Flavobacteriales bacterium]|nr:ABC transporter permease [Flavobacteriales bacterium]
MISEIFKLIRKDILLELRKSHVLGGLILYVLSTIYVCYLGFESIDSQSTWNSLIWIITLFVAFNAFIKTFDHESGELEMYYYTLARPESIILSKIIFNLILMLILSLATVLIYSILMGTDAIRGADLVQFGFGFVLASLGFSATLTLIAGIAVKSNNNVGLTSLLGFPVIIPIILVLTDFSQVALAGMPWMENLQNLLLLVGLNVIVIALAFVLFPYLWRD